MLLFLFQRKGLTYLLKFDDDEGQCHTCNWAKSFYLCRGLCFSSVYPTPFLLVFLLPLTDVNRSVNVQHVAPFVEVPEENDWHQTKHILIWTPITPTMHAVEIIYSLCVIMYKEKVGSYAIPIVTVKRMIDSNDGYGRSRSITRQCSFRSRWRLLNRLSSMHTDCKPHLDALHNASRANVAIDAFVVIPLCYSTIQQQI